MNCPFLINENKATTIHTNSDGVIDQTVVSHERWMAPCMRHQCFYYKERHNNYDELVVDCTRIDRRINLGKN